MAQNFTTMPTKYVNFSIGLIIQSDVIDAKIDLIFYQFRRTFYIVFVLPILSMMVFTFFIGNA